MGLNYSNNNNKIITLDDIQKEVVINMLNNFLTHHRMNRRWIYLYRRLSNNNTP